LLVVYFALDGVVSAASIVEKWASCHHRHKRINILLFGTARLACFCWTITSSATT